MSEWIEWKGGECPVAEDTLVDIRFGLGHEYHEKAASCLEWYHRASGSGADIVAYRLSRCQQSSSALDTQICGDHYKHFQIQPVEFINANNLDFLQGSVIKYISRHKLKGKQADVEKAIHFCKLIIELQYESASS